MKKNFKRILSLVLAIVMCIGQFPISQITARADENDWTAYAAEVTPDENMVYEISTAAQLAWVAKGINDGSITQQQYVEATDSLNYATFRLTADIDLSAHQWIPIGFDNGMFSKLKLYLKARDIPLPVCR